MEYIKTTTELNLNITFCNYKNSFIIIFENSNNKRTYKKEHKKRLSFKQFNNFINTILSYDFLSDRFKVLEKKGFIKEVE